MSSPAVPMAFTHLLIFMNPYKLLIIVFATMWHEVIIVFTNTWHDVTPVYHCVPVICMYLRTYVCVCLSVHELVIEASLSHW